MSLPPNNWDSVFGGPAWTRTTNADGTPGQWFLHLFDSTQPDFDWSNPAVLDEFDRVLRFWLDRGADGFRVDVAHGLIKADGLPDFSYADDANSMGGVEGPQAPYWAQEGVHDVWRRWRSVIDEYDGDRILAAEAWVLPLSKMAKWVRPDEMHQAFNFAYLETDWKADDLRAVIDESLAEFGNVGAPSTWVLSNHDVVRHASRLALGAENPQGHGIGPKSLGLPDPVVGLQRGRAASALMLALPGSAYVYQGEEPRPSRSHRHPRRGPPGPHLVPHRGRALRPRRLPCAAAMECRRARVRLQLDGRDLASPARRVGVPRT
ncbi:hypothetical protein GCM10025876_02580 [Demequina litorisediminis]|uniref:Glycosyl hydrolase family 13 catalytic domain-containing protein n=1 Tax=Demequina litorisediminis TaxID=1849022 RepID=A0ABQ6I8V3_9MICO|nr:hypothetical protein GCM10025876_02580 [Demequina litorisediminis]